MEILLWLVPSALVTIAAMAWVSWVGRRGRGEVDRDVAVARLGKALRKDHRGLTAARPVPPRDRSTGVAVRPSRRPPARPDERSDTRRGA